MKVTIQTILDAQNALLAIQQMKMPIGASFNLSKLNQEVVKEAKLFESERIKKIKEVGKVKDDDPNAYFIPQDDKEALLKFNEDMQELLKTEVEINFEPIDISLFGSNFTTTLAVTNPLRVFLK